MNNIEKKRITTTILVLFVMVCLTLIAVGSVSAEFPEKACEPPPGAIYACEWTAETNFDAIRQWLWYDEDVDIWYWNLYDRQSQDDVWIEEPTFTDRDYNLMPVRSGEATYTDDFALMLHVWTYSSSSSYRECGVELFFENRDDSIFLLTTSRRQVALWWERTRTGNEDFVYDIDDSNLKRDGLNQILLIRQDDVMMLYINDDRAMRYTNVNLPDVTIQTIRNNGDNCFFDLAWVAVP